MSISEEQFSTWSHQGAITTSSNTYDSIKTCLASLSQNGQGYAYDIFLQGSYSNDTNVYKESDVDVVVMLTSLFSYNITNLSEQQQAIFKQSFADSIQKRNNFKSFVLNALIESYGRASVTVGSKSIKIAGNGNRRNADVIVSNQFRDYKYFISRDKNEYDEGIIFDSSADKGTIINYPKLHSTACTQKHQRTKSNFKPIVRIFKNIKNTLIGNNKIRDSIAPSYYLEGLLFNVPDVAFSGSYTQIVHNAIRHFQTADESTFLMPNGKQALFGTNSTQWNANDCRDFLIALISFVG